MVLGADTVVVCDGEVMGKPADAADAARMLLLLSGRTHQVVTGVAVVWGAGSAEVAAEMTHVTMRTLSPRKSPIMWPVASPWTKPAPMPSRAMPEDGFPASTVATSTWSGCRWPWSPACWKEPNSAWQVNDRQARELNDGLKAVDKHYR